MTRPRWANGIPIRIGLIRPRLLQVQRSWPTDYGRGPRQHGLMIWVLGRVVFKHVSWTEVRLNG